MYDEDQKEEIRKYEVKSILFDHPKCVKFKKHLRSWAYLYESIWAFAMFCVAAGSNWIAGFSDTNDAAKVALIELL